MNKGLKKITTGLVIGLMALGIGYSAWQEQLTVDTYIQTGELKLVLSDTAIQDFDEVDDYTDQSRYDEIGEDIISDSDYISVVPDAIVNGDDTSSFSFNVNGLYPGSYAYYIVDIINEGTIPATIQNLQISTDLSESELPYIDVDLGVYTDERQIFPIATNFSISTLESLEAYLSKDANQLTLNKHFEKYPMIPEAKGLVIIGVHMNEDVTDDQIEEGFEFNINVDFEGHQSTVISSVYGG